MPGLIRFANWPYQKEPLDMMADPDVREITLMWGAQVGKTQIMNCGLGYFIEHDPQSQMVMHPTQGDLGMWLETKFNPMVSSNEVIADRIAKARGRDGVNNQRMKSYPGGFLMFAWSGSPNTMRGRSAPKIHLDEVDGYEHTIEGDPISLIEQRQATFGDQRLLMKTSTPTLKGSSRIERSFMSGDRRRFFIPCPHCAKMQTLKWSNVRWDKDENGENLPETAAYACDGCGCLINDGQKLAMLRAGQWRAERPFRGHASFHINELYSPMRKFGDVVASFLKKKEANDMQTFVNVSLAETWEEEGEQIDGAALVSRVEKYRATVPTGGVVLTAGIDMQTDRLEVEVVAWGLGEESWSIEHRQIWGDPLRDDVWEELDAMLSETWQHESGAQMAIHASCLDTGGTTGYTQRAYEYARGKTGRRLFAIKGVGGWGRPVVTAPTQQRSGQKVRRIALFTVGVDEAKLIVMRRLGILKPGAGHCHFPDDRDAEWFHQMTAERLTTRYVRGFAVREWHKRRDRNEALDCRVYAFAALKIVNPNIKKLAEKLAAEAVEPESAVNSPEEEEEEVIENPQGRKRRHTPRRKSGGWMHGYK